MRTVYAQEHDTVDSLAYRYDGHSQNVEAILLANPGLAKLGAVLPIGTAVVLPDSPELQAPIQPLIQLWN